MSEVNEMEEVHDEDNECPWCGDNCFSESIIMDPKTMTGEYGYNCPTCNRSNTKKIV